MNTNVNFTSNILDGMVSAFTLYSGVKLGTHLYSLFIATSKLYPFLWASLYSTLIVVQLSYLSTVHLKSLYMIQEIQLLSSLDKVRIITLQNKKSNIYAWFVRRYHPKEYLIDISEMEFSKKDRASSPIMRVETRKTGLKFYIHKNTQTTEFELLKAILTP